MKTLRWQSGPHTKDLDCFGSSRVYAMMGMTVIDGVQSIKYESEVLWKHIGNNNIHN
jgi:hypothetical protein